MKKFLEFIVTGELFVMFVYFFYLFLKAYINGGRSVWNINYYGEANFELVFFSIILLSGLVLFIFKIKTLFKD